MEDGALERRELGEILRPPSGQELRPSADRPGTGAWCIDEHPIVGRIAVARPYGPVHGVRLPRGEAEARQLAAESVELVGLRVGGV